MATLQQLEETTLRQVNRARRLAGLPELPVMVPATPRDPCGCGLKRGLEKLDPRVFVWTDYVEISLAAAPYAMQGLGWRDSQGSYAFEYLPGVRVRFALSETAKAFVAAFDGGRLPHLIDREAHSAFQAWLAASKTSQPLVSVASLG